MAKADENNDNYDKPVPLNYKGHYLCLQALTGTRYPTLPYPDLIFTTCTLPGKVLEISGFMLVTIHAVSGLYQ